MKFILLFISLTFDDRLHYRLDQMQSQASLLNLVTFSVSSICDGEKFFFY